MQNRDRKNRRVKRIQLMTGIFAAVMTAVVAAGTGDAAWAAEAAPSLPADGMIAWTEERVDGNCQETAGGAYSLRSIRPELSRYDWDCYSSDYYYSKLSVKERQLYERLDAACGTLLTSSDADACAYQVGGTTRRGTKTVSSQGLSSDQVKKVQTFFVYANPQYYFLNTILLTTNNNTCALGIYDAFADGVDRAQATLMVQERLEELQSRVSDNGVTYETEAQIHDLLCDELDYMDGDDLLANAADPYYTQTVYGALMSGETVCAGYTKLYTMLCNYFGIDCVAVTSASHAWNEVRYGDHWYIVDVTWNDGMDRSRFFHLTDRQMAADDQNSQHVAHSYYAGIRPAADTEFDGALMPMQGLAQPEVQVQDTAAGVMVSMVSGEGDIYYTLDGTTPGEGDRYRGPIELTDSGTYIVTAMTSGEGMIPSAYEIFPVRIAAGSVRIASAENVSEKKIRVRLDSSANCTGYEVSYASKADFSNQKSVRLKGRAAMISGLKKGKTYYIRVRGYKKDAYGGYYYTPYTKVKKITVKK